MLKYLIVTIMRLCIICFIIIKHSCDCIYIGVLETGELSEQEHEKSQFLS